MTLAQTIALLDAMPSNGTIKFAAGAAVVLLGIACLCAAHLPGRRGSR